MEITRTPFPFGQLQGFPAMVVDCGGATSDTIDMIARLVRSNMRPADDLVWLKDLDWEQAEAIEPMLVELASHERTSRVTPVAVRQLGDQHWTTAPVYWVLDCSELVAAPTDPDTIRARTQDLPYFPEVDELIVVRPHPDNLVPMVWDELLNWIVPSGPAWVYVEPEHYLRAAQCMYRADHRAGVRTLFELGDNVWSTTPC